MEGQLLTAIDALVLLGILVVIFGILLGLIWLGMRPGDDDR